MIRPAILVLAACTMLAACLGDDDSAPTGNRRGLIDEPRILAVSTDPPVTNWQRSAFLSALVVDANGERIFPPLSWRACSPWVRITNTDSQCGPSNSLPIEGDTNGVEIHISDITAAFAPPFEWEPGDPLPPEQTRLDMNIVVETEVDGRRLIALKRGRVSLATSTFRTNPLVRNLVLDGRSSPTTILAGHTYDLAATLAPELIDLISVGGGGPPELETITVHMFITAGKLNDTDLLFTGGVTEHDFAEETRWTAPESDDAIFWLIAVDSDRGTGWSRFRLRGR